MLYFIPAWYKDNTWNENEQIWYTRKLKSELDETIKEITLFHRNVNQDYFVLVLGYSPNLRHFLHRQGMFRASYWSCFDSIAQIRRKKVSLLSYHDIDWPENVEFHNTPFSTIALIHDKKYAKIEFGEDGNPILIDMYTDGKVCRRNYYDDRGFVSSTVIFEDDTAKYQEFLMENGTWKFRHFFKTGRVLINPLCPFFDIDDGDNVYEIQFSRSEYTSISEVVQEVLSEYIKCASKKGLFFVAAHPLHMGILENCLQQEKYIVTFWGERYSIDRINDISDFLEKAEYVVTDSKLTSHAISSQAKGVSLNTVAIPPFDTRTDFGISAKLKVLNILVPIDGIDEGNLDEVFLEIAEYFKKNEFARAHLFSRNAWLPVDMLRNRIANLLVSNGFEKEWVLEQQEGKNEEKKEDSRRFFFDICVEERDISKCLEEQRIILDVRKKMDVYMFITAISKGIPRISMQKDQFFEHMKNGYQIDSYKEIQKALAYYLDNFENWNTALISCFEYGQKYTTEELLASWRKVLGIVE